MAKMVTLTIDGVQVTVPEGTLIVNAAKKAGIDIPVFCYHPKMEPVGMCRMCLVEVGRPVIDRATGQMVLEEDGRPKILFGLKLETACTTPVSEGMVVLGTTEKAKAGREDILEFLLTSHPLDCPVCDKGGECPLQNLTMGFGPGESRYLYDEKKHMAKHVPLGELIYLDRERCIQCGRCVRFQDEVVDDPVIGFFNRGRSLEIVTFSEPGFDSYWSGNTTDICPVGALTTTNFRFKARPWELRAAASICNHCPVGCNTTLNVRREAVSGGEWVVKRVMPRQNESVNEIWICDKGRFGIPFAARNKKRLTQPLVRRDGELLPATWDEALDLVAERFKNAGSGLFTLAGGRLSNEDLFNLQQFSNKIQGQTALYSHMAGGELTTQIGFTPGTNLADMGAESAILVVASDLEEEAPLWWLRVKQAAERGAKLIVLNPRQTKLDHAASYSLRYPFGLAAAAVLAMVNSLSAKRPELPENLQELARSVEFKEAAQAFAGAENAVVLFGSEGLGITESGSLAQACANLLLATGHTGRPNNGLLGVWSRANDQGAWEIGWKPVQNLVEALEKAQALYIAASDPVGDDPAYQAAFGGEKFVVVQDLYLTQTARLADVVLPVQSFIEREGSYTSGERRVQRFYPAVQPVIALPPQVNSPGTSKSPVLTAVRPAMQGPLADYAIPVMLAEKMGMDGMVGGSAAAVLMNLAKSVPAFEGLTYQKLAEVEEQWPIVGRSDLYYGGTTYENSQGLGVPLSIRKESPILSWPQLGEFKLPKLGLMAFPITRLYDRGNTILPSELLHQRIGEPYVVVSALDAERMKVQQGDMLRITFSATGASTVVSARLDATLPERVVLAPRSFGLPVTGPTLVELKAA
ncbi:MAG TPA: NADH-quinone oxidoreductase subunit NuoG [Anaerolineales bacterium]|nr:NADH-quinone oxidoreductase subunit NuoG [Anaerolineales bacterium]